MLKQIVACALLIAMGTASAAIAQSLPGTGSNIAMPTVAEAPAPFAEAP